MEIQTIINYIPKNEQEQKDKDAMILFANRNKDAFLRSNLIAHFTNSAIVINKEKTKVLFVNHLIYKSWGWVGGHNDGNTNFLEVVIREAIEETGVKKVYPLIEEPIALDNIYVPNHIKNGQYIGDHIHMNLTFVLVADEKDELTTKVDENSGVRWFLIDEVLNHVTESRMISIYNKVFKALKNL